MQGLSGDTCASVGACVPASMHGMPPARSLRGSVMPRDAVAQPLVPKWEGGKPPELRGASERSPKCVFRGATSGGASERSPKCVQSEVRVLGVCPSALSTVNLRVGVPASAGPDRLKAVLQPPDRTLTKH
jgi:hypothetical protein